MSELTPVVQAAILGLMQGLAEFLPISSSAHLVIIPQILGWPYLGKTFDVALHFGTLLALLVAFRQDVKALFRGLAALLFRSDAPAREEARLVKLLFVGCLPAGLIGLIFERPIEERFGGLVFVAAMLIGWGLLLEAADREAPEQHRALTELGYRDALLIGLAQAAALMPGTSRSGATITAALYLGFARTEAARFSFLLSIPVVAGASLLKGIKLASEPGGLDLFAPVLVGVSVSAVSGFLCITYFLRYLRSHSFRPFVIYRVALGLFLLAWAATHS